MTLGSPGGDRGVVERELQRLSTEYAAAVDARDGEKLAQLFVSHGELVVPNFPDDFRPVTTRFGHEAIRHVPDGLRRYRLTFHQLSNHRYDIGLDVASGEVLCAAHHISSAPASDERVGGRVGTDVLWYIRYSDDYRRVDGHWRFLRRELHLQWVEEHAVAMPGATVDDDNPECNQPRGTGRGGGGPT